VKNYEVQLLPRAKLQLYDAALWWAEHRSTEQAVQWLDGLEAALRGLANAPERWPLASDFEDVVRLGREYRDQANRDQPDAETP
jgi:plasmid stabilization system protein ParE